jgi:hypothetical protein
MARVTCRWRIRVFVTALTLIFGLANAAFAQPTLQFELVKYDYPAAPTYAEGEPEAYQRVLVEKGGPVVPGWLVANWLWDMVPSGCNKIPTAKLNFYVYDLVDKIGVAKIKGVAVDQGTGEVAVHLSHYRLAYKKGDFRPNGGIPTDFYTPIGGQTVLWLGYFPAGLSNIGFYLIVRAKGERPAYDGKNVVRAYSKQ